MNSSINNNVNLGGTQNIKGVKTFASIKGPTAGGTSDSTVLATTAFVRDSMSTSGGLSTFSKGQNGYFKMLNGLLIQWGNSGTYSNTQVKTITLPTSFSNTNYVVLPMNSGTTTNNYYTYQPHNQTTTNFKLRCQDTGGSASGSVRWVAIGY